MAVQGYDLIGDVHGCAQTLTHLLESMGYRLQQGCYRHQERRAIFIGDIVDRGNRVRESLALVRAMVERGAAQIVIGNHEYNAIAYHTPNEAGGFLRDHGPRHERQIRETLDQFSQHPDEWQDYLAWFRTLPLYLDLGAFRVIHACWDQQLIDQLRRRGVVDFSDDRFLARSAERGCFEWQVADRLLRGTYLYLPNGEVMVSADGYRRHVYRTKFWHSSAVTHADLLFQPDPLPAHIAGQPLSGAERDQLLHYGATEPPLFIGHYWRQGDPAPITPNIACLDYSAVKAGKLVAYRMDGESTLRADKFVAVPVESGDLPDEELSR
ncbi:metallophosphoesterase [Motiliproteus sediminis]|uniref:metallophosphoesterase n=1 Tax=Motiliproteus sediminis TaxID=1468178 RepID=UPI001AEFCF20|nr:metallophosphoesterase [Motiliproteus sediminis]